MKSKVVNVRETVRQTPLHEFDDYEARRGGWFLTNPLAIILRTQELGENVGFERLKDLEKWTEKAHKGLSTAKKIVQRNLPLNETYTLIDSHYAGAENYEVCDNCNKPITNIAHIKNSKNKDFHVGLDCASTLTGIGDNPYLLREHEDFFKQSASLRAKILKKLKEGFNIDVDKIDDEVLYPYYRVEYHNKRGRSWEHIRGIEAEKYFIPMLKDLIVANKVKLNKSAFLGYAKYISQARTARLQEIITKYNIKI